MDDNKKTVAADVPPAGVVDAPELQTLNTGVSYDPESAEDLPGPFGATADEPEYEPEPVAPLPEGPGLYIVQAAHLAQLTSVSRSATDIGVRSRNRALLRHLQPTRGWRPLAMVAVDWPRRMAELEAIYPHFAELFVYMRAMCAIAGRGDATLMMDPVLINGVPGTGKSTIAERIAPIVSGSFNRIAMSTAQTSSVLGGSETYWSNSETGQVFKALVEGSCANPVILLDELDKVQPDMTYDPIGPLYQLLEPALANRFVDTSVPDLPVDASRIIWLASSNDKRLIPPAILQRFVVFDIPAPTPAQCIAIVRSVDAWLKEHHPALQGLEVDESAVMMLAGLAPREVRKQLLLGYGLAVYHQRNRVTAAEIVLSDDGERHIGFH